MKYYLPFILSEIFLLSVLPVKAADIASEHKSDELRYINSNFSFLGGVGYTSLRADEFVYDADGKKISQLVWTSNAPVITAAAKVIFENDFTLSGNLVVGLTGNSYMKDYDWIEKPSAGYKPDDWSHRSLHSDTQLDRYWTADIALGRNFQVNEASTINLHGGFKYTNVKWSAYGGSYIYSSEGNFRDRTGNFPDGEAGISYEQTYPAAFLGAEATTTVEKWSFSAQLRGGLAFRSNDEDHHWMRNLRFVEKYENTPFISLGARAEYAATERVAVFLSGNLDQYFHKTGDTEIYNIDNGEPRGFYPDGAGMKFRSWFISGGVKYKF